MTAVITGIGVFAPNGLGTEEFWKRTLDGTNGIGPITRFDASGYPVQLAGEIEGFDPAEHLPGRLLPQTDRMTQFALVATDWAMADAGADGEDFDPFDRGVATASSAGGFEFGQKELQALWSQGPEHVSVYQSFAWFYAVNTGQISIRRNMRGPTGVIVTEQAGGLDVIGQARRHIRRGTSMVVTGGMESPLSPWAVAAQVPSGRLSFRGDADTAYLPFDERAQGCVVGEGGAMMIVEDLEKARARGAAQIYGEIAGYAATFDPRPGSGGGNRLAAAIEAALADAGLTAAEVDVVFADAAGTPELDAAEAAALTEVFGPRGVPVTAPKTMTGRLSSGGAPVDVAAALLAIRDGVIPPTVHVTREAFPDGLDLVREARQGAVRTALVVARGHHGFNAALVLRAVS
ncbi:ketosynthase chain-length factor [Streptomyces sp. NPDC052396]|uniref:ketosynthase chain-length factor n=1 Tax=Streptomyces sp. NPDC052396 TaxID=3365689 RepID=UPI0037CEC34B